MESSEVRHTTINGKYRIVLERAASTKGIIGVKVEANGDSLVDSGCRTWGTCPGFDFLVALA